MTTPAPVNYIATLTLSQEPGSNQINVAVDWNPTLDSDDEAPEAYVMMRKLVEGPLQDMAEELSGDSLKERSVN